MSDLGRLILGGLTAGADDSRQNAALLLHAQQIAEQNRRNAALDQIRVAEEARRAQAFQADQAALQGAQTFYGDQFRQMNPAPVASIPQGTEADFFMESPQQHQQAMDAYQQQAGAFATIDPRMQERELARMRRESEDESTFRYLQSQGITAGELPDRDLSQRYVNWKAKNQYALSPNEFADPLPDLDVASARIAPFVQQPMQGPYAPGMAPMSDAPLTPQQAEAYRAAVAMGMQPAQAAAVVFREDQQQDRFAQQERMLELRNQQRQTGAVVPYNSVEEMLTTFPNLAPVAQDLLTRYNRGAITFNDLQQENNARRLRPNTSGAKEAARYKLAQAEERLNALQKLWNDNGVGSMPPTDPQRVYLERQYAQALPVFQQAEAEYMAALGQQPEQPAAIAPVQAPVAAPAATPAPAAPTPSSDQLRAAIQAATQRLGPNASRDEIKALARQILGQ